MLLQYNLFVRPWSHHQSPTFFLRPRSSGALPNGRCCYSVSQSKQTLSYAVLGAGFGGLSVAWHLLKLSSQGSIVHIDLYDEIGIGGGASGVAGGLVHPYSPKVKLLWKGAECWEEAMKLLRVAEATMQSGPSNWNSKISDFNGPVTWRRGIIRPATKIKNLDIMIENAQSHLGSCKLEVVTKDIANQLMPDIIAPLDTAFYMPQAANIHPMRYLQALFSACQDLPKDLISGRPPKEIFFHKKSINNLQELSDGYDAVIVCLGAKSDLLPELSGKLPLRACRGVVTHMQLPQEFAEEYTDDTPSILSDAWVAIQGPRDLIIGSTWDWNSKDYSSTVSKEEASSALGDLLPKASAVFPNVRKWVFSHARGGIRSMPPLTELGSLPLLGCVDDLVGGKGRCKYWFLGGLGARGILYHAWLGKMMAKAVLSRDEDLLPAELTAWRR